MKRHLLGVSFPLALISTILLVSCQPSPPLGAGQRFAPSREYGEQALAVTTQACKAAQADLERVLAEVQAERQGAGGTGTSSSSSAAMTAISDRLLKELAEAQERERTACGPLVAGVGPKFAVPENLRNFREIFPPCIMFDCQPWLFDAQIREVLVDPYVVQLAGGDPDPEPNTALDPEIVSFERQIELSLARLEALRLEQSSLETYVSLLRSRVANRVF